MNAHPIAWLLRFTWLTLPFTLGEALGSALQNRSTAVVATVAVIAWLIWGAVLIASLIAQPVALTVLRVLTPASIFGGAISLGVASDTELLGIIGLATAVIASACALSSVLADEYVDGASYGDERRFTIRVPMGFFAGPIPVFWLLLVGGLTIGPILLAAHSWVAGFIVTAAGVAVAKIAVKAFHSLSRRWLVFVPAGITAIDHLTMVDPVLFSAKRIISFGPALEGTTAVDLTENAPGLVLELAFDTPIEIVSRLSKDEGETQMVPAVLIAASRPGAVLAEAKRRGLPTK